MRDAAHSSGAQAGAARPPSLEFHHVAPYAAGGAATADNIQLRCRAHNQYEARLFFGDTLVRERSEVWVEHTPSEI